MISERGHSHEDAGQVHSENPLGDRGPRKYVPGEVDVSKIDHTHERYGYMDVNDIRIHRIRRFRDGWAPVLDALRPGGFFATTGEILIETFGVSGGYRGKEAVIPPENANGTPVAIKLAWTFPLRFAELASGDGERVYRERIDLSGTPAFGSRTMHLSPGLAGRRRVRLDVWDVAANGAYTQPVWLVPTPQGSR